MGRDDEPKGFIEEAFEHWQHQAESVPADAEADDDIETTTDADADPADAHVDSDETPVLLESAAASGLEAPPAAASEAGSVPRSGDEPAADGQPPAVAPAPSAVETSVPVVAPAPLTAADAALVEEAAKKSALLWLQTTASPGGRAVWHIWLDGAIYLVTGGVEQPDPGLSSTSTTVALLRSKDSTARLVSATCTVGVVRPDDTDWAQVTAALAKGRLNLSEPASAPDRWAGDDGYRIYRLRPYGALLEHPGAYGDVSHRAAPVPSMATTAGPPPKVVHRRQPTGRPLS